MEREANATRTEVGSRATRGTAGRKTWNAPRLTTIDTRDAQSALINASDGLYAVS